MDKQYNVRLVNKIDTLENWLASTLILQNGEVGIAEYTLPDNTKDYLCKIGNGTDTFKDLNIPDSYTAGNGITFEKTDNNTLKSITVNYPIQPITQEEYDKLTEEEKMKDIVYLVTDGEGVVGGSGVTPGTIVIWNGAVSEIPDGWALCNGENGTPDLSNKLVYDGGNFYGLKTPTATSDFSASVSFSDEDMVEVETVSKVYIMKLPNS